MNDDTDARTLFARLAAVLLIASGFLCPKLFASQPPDAPRAQTVAVQDLKPGLPSGLPPVVHP